MGWRRRRWIGGGAMILTGRGLELEEGENEEKKQEGRREESARVLGWRMEGRG